MSQCQNDLVETGPNAKEGEIGTLVGFSFVDFTLNRFSPPPFFLSQEKLVCIYHDYHRLDGVRGVVKCSL